MPLVCGRIVLLKETFQISYLQQEIYSFHQVDLSVTDYFAHPKILWDKLTNLRPIPSSSCNPTCNCDALATVTHDQSDYVIHLLKGLNDSFSIVISQIMLIEPLPCINKVFALVIEHEASQPNQVCKLN